MTAYELMVKTNHQLIKGDILSDEEKAKIVEQLLAARNTSELKGLQVSAKFSEMIDGNKRRLNPVFYIPPYNEGKKLKTIFNQTPKTQILSANMYELEILRLLSLLSPENEDVKYMISETLKRLKTTCFGNKDDGLGECFDASLVVLRFLSTTAPNEVIWIKERIDNYNNHVHEKKRPWYSGWYYWLCLSEMPWEIAKPEIEKYKEEILNWLYNKSCVMNSEQDRIIHPVIISILRNIITKYPEYNYIKCREPYVSEKDGRLHFDMEVKK